MSPVGQWGREFVEDYSIVKNISFLALNNFTVTSRKAHVLLQNGKQWIFYKYGHMVQNLKIPKIGPSMYEQEVVNVYQIVTNFLSENGK